MRKTIMLLCFMISCFMSNGQCDEVSVQIASSDTSYIKLYHAGFFLIPSGFANICEWEVRSFAGEIIHQEITSGNANDQSNSLFDHTIPITDSMKATITITNEMEGISCTMNDTLYWKETEVLPGSFIGNWDVLSSNGGVEEVLSSALKMDANIEKIELYPSPVNDHFRIKSNMDIYSISIMNSKGQIIESSEHINPGALINTSAFPKGLYFVQCRDKSNRQIGIKRLIKL